MRAVQLKRLVSTFQYIIARHHLEESRPIPIHPRDFFDRLRSSCGEAVREVELGCDFGCVEFAELYESGNHAYPLSGECKGSMRSDEDTKKRQQYTTEEVFMNGETSTVSTGQAGRASCDIPDDRSTQTTQISCRLGCIQVQSPTLFTPTGAKQIGASIRCPNNSVVISLLVVSTNILGTILHLTRHLSFSSTSRPNPPIYPT